jgi:uncharacterized protein (DUF58 family)
VSEQIPIWDPDVLARIATIRLRARQAVAGLGHGPHTSIHLAPNVEFADYKPYVPGDAMKDLDWRVLARSDRLVVRRHRAETELPVVIAIDASGDLGTGQGARTRGRLPPPLDGSKWGYAAVLAASLAWWLQRRNEPVGLYIMGGERPRWPWIPPARSGGHLARLIGALAELSPGGKAALDQALPGLWPRLQRRALVVLVSDLMEEPAAWGPALRGLLASRSELRVVHLHDSREWALDFADGLRFRSLEGGTAIPLDPSQARSRFVQVREAYVSEVRGHLAGVGATHLLAATDAPMEPVLSRLLRGLS